jgi:hypothetical protein
MLMMAAIFSGLASMPCSETMNPRSMPRGTLKTHFSGLSFTPFARRHPKSCFEVGEEVGGFPCLDNDVINISLDCSADVLSEHVVHAPLVGRTCIPQAKWHSSVTIHAKGCDERSRELVGFFHLDLVIT